jgi:ABC-type uncharacterized transport system substrate-binding protein
MKKCNVFLMGLAKHDDHKEIALSLMAMLNEIKTPTEEYKPYILLCEDTPKSIQKSLQNNASDGCDVIVSLGHQTTSIITILRPEIGLIPTVFVGVPAPETLGIIQSLEKPGGVMSGVCFAEPSAKDLAEQLQILYPYVTKIHIPYEENGMQGLIKARAESVMKELQSIGFEIIMRPVVSPQEAIDWLEDTIQDIQVILLIEGCIVSHFAESYVAYLCAITDRILISSNGLLGIEQGASFAYGMKNTLMLPEAVNMIRRFWRDRKLLGTQPVVTLPDTRQLFVNKFKLPWLPRILLEKIYTHPKFHVLFKWIRCPIKIERDDS